MPTFAICVKAECENIASFGPAPGAVWKIDVKDPAGDDTREGVFIDPSNVEEVKGGRGDANFILNWTAKRQGSITMLPVDTLPNGGRFIASDAGDEMMPVALLECRNIEPTAFYFPPEGWTATAVETGTVFGEGVDDEAMDCTDDWCDYDEAGDASVSLTSFASEVRRFQVKKKGKGKKRR